MTVALYALLLYFFVGSATMIYQLWIVSNIRLVGPKNARRGFLCAPILFAALWPAYWLFQLWLSTGQNGGKWFVFVEHLCDRHDMRVEQTSSDDEDEP